MTLLQYFLLIYTIGYIFGWLSGYYFKRWTVKASTRKERGNNNE
jgi:hypothetical protein